MISPEVSYEEYFIKQESIEYLENSEQIVFEDDTAKCGEVMVGNQGEFTFICELCKQHFIDLSSFGSHIRVQHLKHNASNTTSIENDSKSPLCEEKRTISVTIQREIKPEVSLLVQKSAPSPIQKEFETEFLDTMYFSDCDVNENSRDIVSNCEESTPVAKLSNSSKEGEFLCTICGRSYQVISSYRRHMRKRHPVGVPDQVICKYCDKEFANGGELEAHIRKHTGKKRFVCPMCPKAFGSRRDRQSHINTHTGERPYKCSHCANNFFNALNLKKHKCPKKTLTTISTEKDHSRDPLCEERSGSYVSPQREIKPQAPPLVQKSAPSPIQRELEIEILETAASSDDNVNEALRDKVSSCEGDTPVAELPSSMNAEKFVCKICKRSYQVIGSYRRHMRNRHPVGVPEQVICKYCDKEFADGVQLEEHIRTHTGKKRFVCPLCPRAFEKRSNRQSHINRHTGERLYKCSHCAKAFFQANLKKHKCSKNHLGDNAFTTISVEKDHRRDPVCEAKSSSSVSPQREINPESPTLVPMSGPYPIQNELEIVFVDAVASSDCNGNEGLRDEVPSCGESAPIETFSNSTKVERFDCTICGLSYQAMSSYRRHVRKKHPQIKEDGSASISNEDLKANDSSCEENTPVAAEKNEKIICVYCGRDYQSKDNLKLHIKRYHGDGKDVEPAQLICMYCDKEFDDPVQLNTHVGTHVGRKRFVCPFCSKLFRNRHARQFHINVHTGDRPYKCSLCPKKFAHPTNLENHESAHLKIKKFACRHCGKRFVQSNECKGHERIHTGEKPFQCEECGRRFTLHVKLSEHRKRHKNIKPYVCTVCNKAFYNSTLLKNHMPIHTNERPHHCNICGKSYPRLKSLRLHLQLHSNERKYVCNICGEAFLQSSGLYSHRKSHGEKL